MRISPQTESASSVHATPLDALQSLQFPLYTYRTRTQMVGLLRDAVRPEGGSTIPAIDACFEADDAGVLEKRMRSYALECFSNGLPAHPRWLLQVPGPPHTCARSLAPPH
jgi:hypothetical protein